MSGICLEICHQKIQIKTTDEMLIVMEGGWYVDFCYIVLLALFKMVHVKELKRSPQTTMLSKADKIIPFWVCYWDYGWKYQTKSVDYGYVHRPVIGCISIQD